MPELDQTSQLDRRSQSDQMAGLHETDEQHEDRDLGDRIGVVVSSACAVHCALVPVLLVVLPAAGVALGDERLEWGMLGLAGLIAGWSLGRGYRLHKSARVLVFLVIGLSFLVVARSIEQYSDRVVLAAAVSILGAGALVMGHLQNLRLSRLARLSCQTGALPE